MTPDMFRIVMERAVELYSTHGGGEEDGIFTCATFSHAFGEATQLPPLDGILVRFMLRSREDVKFLDGDISTHFRLLTIVKETVKIPEPIVKEFVKADSDKNRLELLPFEALEEVGKVLTFGAKKYRDHNWRKCPQPSRYVGAALRHLFAWSKGEDLDPETGLSHIAHASCCCLFLLGLILDKKAVDDRDHAPVASP